MDFNPFDPLAAKSSISSEMAFNAIKREIQNILDSYVGRYDSFCELIQNALDAVDARAAYDSKKYEPTVKITINLPANMLTVTDNGTGLSKDEYESFLAPSFSFKSGNTRGHKGVGATYLAYGFDYIQICTKNRHGFQAIGKMLEARTWLDDPSPAGNPKVVPDTPPRDPWFTDLDCGTSVSIGFSPKSKPADLSWVRASTAEQWKAILSVKTALGVITENSRIKVLIDVFDNKSQQTNCEMLSINYLWPHTIVNRPARISDIFAKQKELRIKSESTGNNYEMPAKFKNIECVYDFYSTEFIKSSFSWTDDELLIISEHSPTVYCSYVYSAGVWNAFNEGLKIRKGTNILSPGIQIASNNMPQGEIFQVGLTRYIGRQNQMHIVTHFDNCRPDLGRKGFQKNLVDFSQSLSRLLLDKQINPVRRFLRKITGGSVDLLREQKVDGWKKSIEQHEKEHPLELTHECFFLPMQRISITSEPTREQDVIALFNQLIAGGVIRGIRIMSTNESFVYDGMYKIVMDEPREHYIYRKETNPLGISEDANIFNELPFISSSRILEYKKDLDGLIADVENGDKNTNDINLVVVWDVGNKYEENYFITSLLDTDNISLRSHHGVTHIISNLNSNQREMDLIVLKDLIEYLSDQDKAIQKQKKLYDE